MYVFVCWLSTRNNIVNLIYTSTEIPAPYVRDRLDSVRQYCSERVRVKTLISASYLKDIAIYFYIATSLVQV